MSRAPELRFVAALALLATPLAMFGCLGADESDSSPEPVVEAQQPACDFGPSVPGLDVSTYQGTVDWPTVAADGWKFVITRIGDGLGGDDQFAANWPGIKAAGMIRGAYQFFRPSRDPLEQAQIVIDAVGVLGPGDLPVTIDVEAPDPGVDKATYAAAIGTWIDAVEAGTGKKPIIYTGRYYWNDYVGTDAFSDHLLWLAAYTNNQDCPTPPDAWPDWDLWQWTSTGTVPGMPQASAVDHNFFKGTEADLRALANGGSYAATLDAVDLPATVLAGETFDVSITFTNTGGEPWDASTRLGTSEPRDRESAFAAPSWPQTNRAAAVTGAVPVGGTYTFDFAMQAPDAPGAYAESFALVQEGVTWFADAGGPADDAVRLAIQVVDGGSGGPGTGSGDAGAGGAAGGGSGGDDAASAAAGSGEVGGDGGGGASADGAAADEGCAVRAAGPAEGRAGAAFVAAMFALLATLRRRRSGVT